MSLLSEIFPDEKASEEDLAAFLRRVFPIGDPGLFAERVFSTLPRTGPGPITREDVFMFIFHCSRSLDFLISWIFKFYDHNGDGLITEEDWTKFHRLAEELVGSGEDPLSTLSFPDAIFEGREGRPVNCREFNSICKRTPNLLKAWRALGAFLG